jgi:hypothetical protein
LSTSAGTASTSRLDQSPRPRQIDQEDFQPAPLGRRLPEEAANRFGIRHLLAGQSVDQLIGVSVVDRSDVPLILAAAGVVLEFFPQLRPGPARQVAAPFEAGDQPPVEVGGVADCRLVGDQEFGGGMGDCPIEVTDRPGMFRPGEVLKHLVESPLRQGEAVADGEPPQVALVSVAVAGVEDHRHEVRVLGPTVAEILGRGIADMGVLVQQERLDVVWGQQAGSFRLDPAP